LGLPQDPLQLHTPLVIARGRRSPFALLVNRVTGVMTSTPAALLRLASTDSFNGCVEGRLVAGGHEVNLLSIDRLLLAKEEQVLAEFQAAEARRFRQIDTRAS
jgi:chemotaxis signal transduction protein